MAAATLSDAGVAAQVPGVGHSRGGDALRGLGWLALGALALGYLWLVHRLIAGGQWPTLAVFLGLLPVLLVPTLIAFGAGHRVAALLGVALALALAWHARFALQANYGWLYLTEHVGTQLLLCWMFGRTLRGGQLPLITRLALTVHGTLAPEVARYTRRATLAWSAFFALDAALSLLLFAFAPLALWSLFANLLTLPLVLAMFAGEYLVRRLALPQMPHVSIATGVRAFWSDRAASRG